MSRRIEIELTSKRPDGTWTWRAAGAREPRGVVEDAVVPSGASVNDLVRAEVETDLDGSRVLSITSTKTKTARVGLLEILPSQKPFELVTQQLRKKGPRDGDKRGGRDGDKRRGPRPDGPGGDRPRGPRSDGPGGDKPRGPRREGSRDGTKEGGAERSDRPRRPFFETPPELPQRAKPKRIRPLRVNVDAVLAELPEAQRTIAEKVLNGGIPTVRAAIEEQNTAAVAAGKEKIPAEGLIQIAENLLPRLRIAEWRDKALSAERIMDDIDLRDLRAIVVTADTLVNIDEPTRALVAKMKSSLVVRQETEIKNWIEDITTATTVGRVVRALRLSSQPPKAGFPFPAPLAAQLATATIASLTIDAPAERWIALLEASAFSPIRALVLPTAPATVVSEELMKTVVRLGPLMPQVAALFGVVVDPKARAPRPLQMPRSSEKGTHKRAGDLNKAADGAPSGKKQFPDKKRDAPKPSGPRGIIPPPPKTEAVDTVVAPDVEVPAVVPSVAVEAVVAPHVDAPVDAPVVVPAEAVEAVVVPHVDVPAVVLDTVVASDVDTNEIA